MRTSRIRSSSIGVAFLAATLLSCRTSPRVPPTNVTGGFDLSYPRFQTFPTPRTFDGPGEVFRIDQHGKRQPVTNVASQLPPLSAGSEFLPRYSSKTHGTVDAMLAFLGRTTANASLDARARQQIDVTVELFEGERERSYDEPLKTVLQAYFDAYPMIEGSDYFVIRETIAFSKISYVFSQQDASTIGGELGVHQVAILVGAHVRADENSWVLDQVFETPHRVFFNADRIKREKGKGDQVGRIVLLPAPPGLRWEPPTVAEPDANNP